MVDYNPTVIAAALNDNELKSSIDSLVGYVQRQTQTMATGFNEAIKSMEERVKNISLPSASVGKSQVEATLKNAKKEADATTVSFNTLAETIAKATRPSTPAQDSYYTIVKSMRENVALLAMEIKDMPNWSLDRQFGNYMQYERQIEQVRQRIQELKQELQNVGSEPNASRLVIKQITEQIAQEQQRLVQLQNEQLTTTKQIELADKQTLAQKQAQYESEKKALLDMSVGQRERITFGERQVAQEAKITDEIRRQAEEIRKSAEWKKHGTYEVFDKETSTTYRVSKQIELSVEEQILAIQKEKSKQIYQSEVEQQKQNSFLSETLNIERQITEEQGKRKRYTAPTIATEMNISSYLKFAQERAKGDILSYNELTSSSKRLNDALKQQQRIYSTLTADERAHPFGQTTLANIQGLQRAIHNLNSQMSRPMSLASINAFHPKTLDDIAYKIQMLQRYRSGLDIKGQANEIKTVNTAIADLNKRQTELLGKNKSLLESNNALARSWNYMKNRLAFYFTVGASTAFVKNLIEVRSQYEMNERALGILINSAERGTQIFKELSEMSLVSPYTLIELSSAAKQLTAYDVAAKDVVDTTRRLADMAAAVGQPIERLTYALGQIKAYGYLNSRDQRMFANAGIPLVRELAKYYTELEGRLVSTGDVYDRIKKRAVGYNEVMQVVNRMTDEGGKFFNFQAKMADTLKVQLANLTLAWNNMLNDIGKDSQGVISYSIKGLKEMFLHWRQINDVILNVAKGFGLLKGAQLLYYIAVRDTNRAIALEAVLGETLAGKLKTLRASIIALATSTTVMATAGIAAFVALFSQMSRITEETKNFNTALRESAKIAAKTLDELLKDESMRKSRLAAESGSLSANEAEKTWNALREEIENTAKSHATIVRLLLEEEDLNKRVTDAFNVTEKLRDANEQLSHLIDESIALRKHWYQFDLGGIVQRAYKQQRGETTIWDATLNALNLETGRGESPSAALKERIKDLTWEIASSIEKELGEEGMRDKIKVAEAVELARKTIIDSTPEIQGSLRNWFNVQFDYWLSAPLSKYLDNQGNEIFDRTTTLTQIVLSHISADSRHVFRDITDDILNGTHEWSDEQLNAIQKAIDKSKEDVPKAWHSTLDEMMDDLNSRDWKINIMATLGVEQRSGLQKQFDREFRDPITGKILNDFSVLRPKDEDDLLEYRKRINETIEKGKEKEEALRKQAEASRATNEELADSLLEEANAQNKANKAAESIKNTWHLLDEEKNKSRSGSQKDPLGDAIQKNIQYISELQKKYKEYLSEGYDRQTALTEATNHYSKSLARVNAELARYGIEGLTGERIATMDLREVRDYYQTILERAQGSAKATEALEKAIGSLDDEIMKTSQKTVVDSLKMGLSNVKDEYELALDFDANPEMGDVFAEMMGISRAQLEELPHDFEGVVRELQRIIDEQLGAGKFNLTDNLNRKTFENWVANNELQADSKLVQELKAITDYANKIRQDEVKNQTEAWNKLLEKYAEYEYKRKQIMLDYEREMEVARKRNAGDDVFRAIENSKDRRLAQTDFEQFQQSPEWITAVGDVSKLTDKALHILIDDIEAYKATAKDLDPKKIREIERTLTKLRNKLRGNNAFSAIANEAERAKDVYATSQEKIDTLKKKYEELQHKIQSAEGTGDIITKEDLKQYEKLPQLIREAEQEQEEFGKMSKEVIAGSISDDMKKLAELFRTVSEIMTALGANDDAIAVIDGVADSLDGLAEVMDGFKQFANKDFIGGFVGVVKGLFNTISSWFKVRDRKITNKIKESERQISRLENAYSDLQHSIEKVSGAEQTAYQREAIAQKEAMLVEQQRQLQLERSRKSKDQDQDKMIELEGQIQQTKNEIMDLQDEIVATLTGEDLRSAAENFVDAWVEAWKEGESALDALNDKVNDLALTLVKNAITKELAQWYLKPIYDVIKSYAGELSEGGVQMTQGEIAKVVSMASNAMKGLNESLEQIYGNLEMAGVISKGIDANEMQLSNLQQGIQSLSEDTGNAIESYLNGISQQIYLHSEVLTQIRDAVVGFDLDVQLGVQSQMLLQLQNSYQVQMSIQTILQDALSPTGRSFMVELAS